MPPTMHVLTHSYNKEMAEVDDIRDVIGGSSFLTSRGSSGVRIANYMALSAHLKMLRSRKLTNLMTLMSIQLLLLPVKIPKSSGARGR